MSNRRPRLTLKACRGMVNIWTSIQGSELDLTAEGKEREELDSGMKYISDLCWWFRDKKQREKEEKQRRDTVSKILSEMYAKEKKEISDE